MLLYWFIYYDILVFCLFGEYNMLKLFVKFYNVVINVKYFFLGGYYLNREKV